MNTHASLGIHKLFDRTEISAKVYSFTQLIERGFASVTTLITLWSERSRDRQHLAEMSPRLLQDIGMDSVQARIEANKPFWRA